MKTKERYDGIVKITQTTYKCARCGKMFDIEEDARKHSRLHDPRTVTLDGHVIYVLSCEDCPFCMFVPIANSTGEDSNARYCIRKSRKGEYMYSGTPDERYIPADCMLMKEEE